MSLPDGRVLAYEVMGDRAGFPVMVLHGTPGRPGSCRAWISPPVTAGVALIAPDRGG